MFDAGSIITAIAGIFQSVANGKLEREIGNALASTLATNLITGLWSQGSQKWLRSEGEVLKDMAMGTYLTLRTLESKGFLTLTVPQDMLKDVNRMAKFQTEGIKK